jgi:predicted branched-subunit amino acid permease
MVPRTIRPAHYESETKLTTFFDFLSVICFIGLVIAFFQLTERDMRTLAHLLLSGIAFAVANQVGNAGSTFLAIVLVGAGVGYAALVVRGGLGGSP